jgi:hypothetical protein
MRGPQAAPREARLSQGAPTTITSVIPPHHNAGGLTAHERCVRAARLGRQPVGRASTATYTSTRYGVQCFALHIVSEPSGQFDKPTRQSISAWNSI